MFDLFGEWHRTARCRAAHCVHATVGVGLGERGGRQAGYPRKVDGAPGRLLIAATMLKVSPFVYPTGYAPNQDPVR